MKSTVRLEGGCDGTWANVSPNRTMRHAAFVIWRLLHLPDGAGDNARRLAVDRHHGAKEIVSRFDGREPEAAEGEAGVRARALPNRAACAPERRSCQVF